MRCSKKSKLVKGANLGREWLPKSLLYQKISPGNLPSLKDLFGQPVFVSKKPTSHILS